jgi:hypothetical protein
MDSNKKMMSNAQSKIFEIYNDFWNFNNKLFIHSQLFAEYCVDFLKNFKFSDEKLLEQVKEIIMPSIKKSLPYSREIYKDYKKYNNDLIKDREISDKEINLISKKIIQLFDGMDMNIEDRYTVMANIYPTIVIHCSKDHDEQERILDLSFDILISHIKSCLLLYSSISKLDEIGKKSLSFSPISN